MRSTAGLRRSPAPGRLGLPATLSLVLHASAALAVFLAGRGSQVPLPPVYRVHLVAAPRGERAIGVVNPAPTKEEAPPTPPKRAETVTQKPVPAPPKKAPPKKAVPPVSKATQTPEARSAKRDEPAPKAGGGPEGGTGADVANVDLSGQVFPFQPYLHNIVNQLALRFKPRNPGQLHAEVVFLIQRDGSVLDSRLRQKSGSYAFDIEALGAVESASRAKAFGPLPEGYSDDVLTVIFTFDSKIIR